MKRQIFLIPLILILSILPAFAIDWHTANQITIHWDATTTLADGTPILATDTIMYGIYIREKSGTESKLLETSDTVYTHTFTQEGQYIIGVSTVRYVEYGTENEIREESEVNWSDVNGEATPDPFGLRYAISPVNPINLRKE